MTWRGMQHVNQAYRILTQDMDMRRIDKNRRCSIKTTEGTSDSSDTDVKENFQLTLDVGHFSPDELTVKTQGRRLIVIGKHDKKGHEDGSYFHEYREWKREAELPKMINPEQVVCSLSRDGHLHIQAPRLALPTIPERPIPIIMIQESLGTGNAI
ncbi:hypothetical protein GDO86_012517 [Hymenochirus boettgeri]|uniref:SHSP domain-containing protein n=1 Tax=Hymenochirus boettgeri TaxID=247094 RepID=A0A8T2ISU8_9PIPI|nr:hypothetical protein GDO86_012517 [Hymenochirus boettgeri]